MLKNEPFDLREEEAEAAQGADERLALVRQILASRTFAKSVRLSQFFEFICDRALTGRTHEINEHQIGIHVFGRNPSYNATDDSIVRTQARLLRQRLEEYFEHECSHCPMIVVIPKGGYVPVFERRPEAAAPPVSVGTQPTEVPAPVVEQAAQQPERPGPEMPAIPAKAPWPARNWEVFAWSAGALLLIGLAALFAPRHPAAGDTSGLWQTVFSSGRPVVIVPSDDGLVLSEELRRAPVNLDEYLSGSYLHSDQASASSPAAARPLGTEGPITGDWLSAHQYTSTADLALAMRLDRLPEAASASVETRYARVLRLDDLKSSNVILIGGVGANPWVSLFAPVLNFDVNYDWKNREGYVRNKNPRAGELRVYPEQQANGAATSYGVLALVPGIAGEGSALLFEGSGMAGTEAAADFPFSGEKFQHFLDALGARRGEPMPYFEVLLETQSLAGNAPEAHVLAWRRLSR